MSEPSELGTDQQNQHSTPSTDQSSHSNKPSRNDWEGEAKELGFEFVADSSTERNLPPPNFMQPPTEPQRQVVEMRTSTLSILLFVLCFLLALYLIPTLASQISYSVTRGSEKAKAEAAEKLLKQFPDNLGMRTPWVVKRTSPSVVGIQPIQKVKHNDRVTDEVTGEGSGVIVDSDGYILTNYHVVAGSARYFVSLSDGRRTDNVRLVGFDQKTDIAVLKIALHDLTPMTWGDSNALEVGEPVLAIGNPYGFANTVTLGIISAKERYTQDMSIDREQLPQEYLQTDTAINPGNSGGPLVNIRGEMIGINTAIIGETYRGICFAIPSSLARYVYEEIRKNQKVSYGVIGVQLATPVANSDDDGHRSLGVLVRAVFDGFPAAKAGLQAGDIITEWDGHEITDSKQLTHLILFTKPGTTVKMSCLRDKTQVDFNVTVADRPVMR